jgi:hypothetical protein
MFHGPRAVGRANTPIAPLGIGSIGQRRGPALKPALKLAGALKPASKLVRPTEAMLAREPALKYGAG